MNRCTLSLNTGESLTFAIETEGLCGICLKEPSAEHLDMTLATGRIHKGEPESVRVTMCRHCLSEHAPQLLAVLEAKA